MNIFYSNLIVPLFNKQKALEEGELRTEIESLAQKAGFNLKNIWRSSWRGFTVNGKWEIMKYNMRDMKLILT